MKTVRTSFFGEDVKAEMHPHLNILCATNGLIYNLDTNYATFGGRMLQGYLVVKISHKFYRVHRLIAETFLQNPENKPVVDHINRDPSDNRLSNLRWATVSENTENSFRMDNRHKGTVRRKDDPAGYKRERVAAGGYGKIPVIDDEFHARHREYNKRYRERKRNKNAASK